MDKFKTMQKFLTQLGVTILLILVFSSSLYAQYTLTDNDVVVEEGVITSCSYDFALKDIIIPGTLDGQTVTGIGGWVFHYEGITSVVLPQHLETIGYYAFGSNALINISLPASLISIEGNAFSSNYIGGLDLSNCTSLTSIGSSAFSSNDIVEIDLTSCTSLVSIGESAFYGNAIEAVDLSSCTSLLSIGSSAFSYNSLSSFTLPEVTYLGTVYTVWNDGDGNSYHAGLDGVTNFSTFYLVYIPYTLTDDDVIVEEGEITSCSYDFELKNIIIPDMLDGQSVTGIGNWVFDSKGIASITLPAGM